MSKIIDFRHDYQRSSPELVTFPTTFLGRPIGDFVAKTMLLTCVKCGKTQRVTLSADTLGQDFQVLRDIGGVIVRSFEKLPEFITLDRCLVGAIGDV